MRFSQVAAASLVAPLAAAHGAGMEGMPKIFGMPKQLRASNPFTGFQARHAAHPVRAVGPRQAVERCGPENSNQVCGGNDCCSSAGYCGTTQEHCQAPDCLFNFGPGCDANKTPNGESTRNIPRPKLGSIPYGGAGIYVCNNPGTVAITYDDGPYIYTESVMQQFEARGGHATFFITGNNIGKGAIDENWAGVIQKMYENGHQVASHTWSHQDLSKISKEEVYDQMVKNEMALRNILGKFPTYMRPPYSSCDLECQEVMADLGYVVSYFDLDTDDYNQLTPVKIQNAKDNFKEGIDTRNNNPFDGDRLVIGHDIHELTAENLTAYMLDYLYSQGLEAVTMGECLQDPKENWYRDSTPAPPSTSSTSTSSSTVPTPTGPTSTDGSCGASGSNQSCIGFVGLDDLLGECCSQHGWCGRTSDHCQTGCQAGFGKCGAQPSASPSASATVSASVTGPVPTPTGPATTDGSCGASNNDMTCIGFVGPAGLSECCSEYGYCGNTDVYCAAGCQAGFGKCGEQDLSPSSVVAGASSSSLAASTSPAPSSSADASKDAISSMTSTSVEASSTVEASEVSSAPSATPTTSGEMSRDGSCGGQKGYTCVGFNTLEGAKSECCSAWGYCGSSEDHCGAGCNPVYGNCPSVSSSFSTAVTASSATEKSESTSSRVATASSEAVSSSASSVSTSASEDSSASTSEHVSATASASASEYASASISEQVSASASASTSASVSDYISASVSEHISASATVSASEKPEGHDSASASATASSEAVHPSSTGETASKDTYPTDTAIPSEVSSEYPTSTPEHSETPASSSYPIISTMTPSPIHPSSSSFSTAIVRPTSTSCSTSATPSPTKLPVSQDGKCGEDNGGQTCAGYKTSFGLSMGCCCKQSGRCSTDPWACGLGCDKGYGKCWF